MRLEVETGGVRTRPHLDRLPSSYFRSWWKPPEMAEEFRTEARDLAILPFLEFPRHCFHCYHVIVRCVCSAKNLICDRMSNKKYT